MSIGEQIKELLHARKITQKQLAKELNIPPTTLSGYIRDFREPDAETLKIIANYFDVTIDYLLCFNLAAVSQNEKFLNASEVELLGVYRRLKWEYQRLLIEHGKLMDNFQEKKRLRIKNA